MTTGGAANRPALAERVVISVPLDPYLSLKALAAHSGLSLRTLRRALRDRAHPLPHFKVGGRVLVRASHLDGWLQRFFRVGLPPEARDPRAAAVLAALDRARPRRRRA